MTRDKTKTNYRLQGHGDREVAYCDTCGTMSPWHTALALGERCYRCGSDRISRGTTGNRYKIREVNR